MVKLWCWHCEREVLMLEEHEWGPIAAVDKKFFDDVKSAGSAKEKLERSEKRKVPWMNERTTTFEQITGSPVTCSINNHRAWIYGPPCTVCGKPLRTPQARYCAFCNSKVDTPDDPPEA